MSKELEVFNRVWEDCSKLDLGYVSKHNLMDDLREIKQALTPPTADEVCKALSEHFKRYSGYDEQTKRFYFYDGLSTFNYITTWGLYGYKIDIYLPPRLITLIGRFYEGLENE